jgi:hypothetical protein
MIREKGNSCRGFQKAKERELERSGKRATRMGPTGTEIERTSKKQG